MAGEKNLSVGTATLPQGHPRLGFLAKDSGIVQNGCENVPARWSASVELIPRAFSLLLSRNKMEKLRISGMRVVPCVDSKFIQPARVIFNQNDHKREWDYLRIHDSVSALLFNKTRQAFILVKQFRPAVYMHVSRNLTKVTPDDGGGIEMTAEDPSTPMNAPAKRGVTYELCAGIVDKKVPLSSVAKQEILEECGYDVPEDKLEKITSWRAGIGISGSVQTLFFAEVTDNMQVHGGGGNPHEGEQIEVVYLPLEESREFLFDETKEKPAGLLFAFMWYFDKFKV